MTIVRKLLQVVAFICTLLIGVTSMMVIVSQTTWFKEWLRGFIIRQADDYVNGRLTIGRIDGNLFFGVEMEDVDVTQNGRPVVSLKDVGVDYNFLTFLGGNVILDHIRLNEPTLHVTKTATGWNLTELIKAQTPNPTQPKNRRPIDIGEIGVSGGTLYLESTSRSARGTRSSASTICPASFAATKTASPSRTWHCARRRRRCASRAWSAASAATSRSST